MSGMDSFLENIPTWVWKRLTDFLGEVHFVSIGCQIKMGFRGPNIYYNRFLIKQTQKTIDTSRRLRERKKHGVQRTTLQPEIDGMAIFLHFH